MAKALVLFQLSVLLLSSFTVLSHGEWYSLDKSVDHLSPAQAPKPHKSKGHHKKSPAPSPVYSPTKPPAKSPTPPPAKPPTPPPAKPPVKPPAYSPSKPPAKSPTPPPAKPPTTPPAKPPVKPPTPSPSPSPSPAPAPSRQPVAVRGLVYCKPCKFRGVETLNQAKPLQGAVVELVCKINSKKAIVEQGTTDKNGFFWITPKLLTSGGYRKCRVFLVSSNTSSCDVPTNFNNGKSGASLKYTPLPSPPAPAPIKYDVFTVGPFGFEPSKKVTCKK